MIFNIYYAPSCAWPPCGFFAVGIENALDVPVQRQDHANAREHRIAVALSDQQERLHRGLPFLGVVLGLRQLGDVVRGVAQRERQAKKVARRSPFNSNLLIMHRRHCAAQQFARGN